MTPYVDSRSTLERAPASALRTDARSVVGRRVAGTGGSWIDSDDLDRNAVGFARPLELAQRVVVLEHFGFVPPLRRYDGVLYGCRVEVGLEQPNDILVEFDGESEDLVPARATDLRRVDYLLERREVAFGDIVLSVYLDNE